jgi:hypothetical protein
MDFQEYAVRSAYSHVCRRPSGRNVNWKSHIVMIKLPHRCPILHSPRVLNLGIIWTRIFVLVNSIIGLGRFCHLLGALPGFIMDIGALSWSGEQHYLRQSSNAFSEEVLQAFTTSNLGRYLSRIIDMKQEAVRTTAREDAICGVEKHSSDPPSPGLGASDNSQSNSFRYKPPLIVLIASETYSCCLLQALTAAILPICCRYLPYHPWFSAS